MLATSKNVLFPGHNHNANHQDWWPFSLIIDWVPAREIIEVKGHQYQSPGSRTFLEEASIIVTWWKRAFLPSEPICFYDQGNCAVLRSSLTGQLHDFTDFTHFYILANLCLSLSFFLLTLFGKHIEVSINSEWWCSCIHQYMSHMGWLLYYIVMEQAVMTNTLSYLWN